MRVATREEERGRGQRARRGEEGKEEGRKREVQGEGRRRRKKGRRNGGKKRGGGRRKGRRRKAKEREKGQQPVVVYFFLVYLELFLIYCMNAIFFKLFVHYYSIVYEKLVFQKLRNPNKCQAKLIEL